jgi:hypothetical protein
MASNTRKTQHWFDSLKVRKLDQSIRGWSIRKLDQSIKKLDRSEQQNISQHEQIIDNVEHLSILSLN